VPTPGSFRPRQGRLRRYGGAIPLPTLWFELGGYSIADYSSEALWKLPNTYPLIRVDARLAYNSGGYYSYEYLNRPPTPDEFATSLANLITAYQNAYGPHFQSVGKRFRYGMMFKGPDDHDCPLKLVRHPEDFRDHLRQRPWNVLGEKSYGRSRGRLRRNRTMQGYANQLGADSRCAFFHIAGRKQVRDWAIPAFAAARSRLDSDQLPHPEFMLTDLESDAKNSQISYSVQFGTYPPYDPLVTAWYEKLERDYKYRPRYQDYLLDGDVTFGQWMEQHQTTLAGNPLPAHDRHYYANHPHENDLYWRMFAVNEASYSKSLQVALYEPAKTAFGSGLKCGEWNQFSDGRLYPSEIRPRLMRYWKDGVFGMDFQIPAYYPQGLTNYQGGFDTLIPPGDADPGWHSRDNWRGRLQSIAATPTDLLFESSSQQQGAVDWGAVRSGAAELFPSSSIEFLLRLGNYPQYRNAVVDRLLRNILDGARNIWMFEPKFNMPPDTNPDHAPNPEVLRAAVYAHVLELNGLITGLSPRRNRMNRSGQPSFSFLGVNRP
jgi:hypothetical protein